MRELGRRIAHAKTWRSASGRWAERGAGLLYFLQMVRHSEAALKPRSGAARLIEAIKAKLSCFESIIFSEFRITFRPAGRDGVENALSARARYSAGRAEHGSAETVAHA